MSERDRILGIQRELDRMNSLQKHYEKSQAINREIERYSKLAAFQEMERTERQARLGSVQEYFRQLERSVRSPLLAALDEKTEQIRRSLLQVAMEPLARSLTLNHSVLGLSSLAYEGLGRLSEAAANAVYLGEVELSDEESEDEEVFLDLFADEAGEVVESQLVEVVPADTLAQLRRVEFAPITMLDRILRSPEAMRSFEGRDFERFIATLIDQIGFEDVVLTPRSGDEGRDILATKTIHGIKIFFAFECKRYKDPVGPDILRALLGTIRHGGTAADKGVLVTTSRFTTGARTFILTEPSIDGKDFDGIVDWLGEYSKRTRKGINFGGSH